MKAADLREKSADDLRELEKTLARDVFQNRLKNFTNRLDDTSAIRKTRRDLARVITLLRERELGPAPVAAPVAPAKAPTAEEEPKPAKKTAEAKSVAGEATQAKPMKSAAKKAKKSEAKEP
jgi:large subunit ribosomal protein L29